jgi:hypothetical protein
MSEMSIKRSCVSIVINDGIAYNSALNLIHYIVLNKGFINYEHINHPNRNY